MTLAEKIKLRLSSASSADRRYERPMSWDEADELIAEIERLRLWIRRIENINDSPSCFNSDIDAACRAAFHGLPMNGKINVQLPDLPEKE